MHVWSVSLPAFLTTNYPWLSTMNWRPTLTGLAPSLVICHVCQVPGTPGCLYQHGNLSHDNPSAHSTHHMFIPDQRLLGTSVPSASTFSSMNIRCVLILLPNQVVCGYHPRKQFADQDKWTSFRSSVLNAYWDLNWNFYVIHEKLSM